MTGKFLKVKCAKCKNEQTVFEKPSTAVNCIVCGEALARNTGGKAEFKTKILGVVSK